MAESESRLRIRAERFTHDKIGPPVGPLERRRIPEDAMKIAKLFGRARPVFSFEFFPPRTDAGYTSLFRTVAELKELTPGFVSVTWGAGGSTRRKTVELVARIQGEIGLTAMAHLTCVGSSRSELAETLDRLEE